MRAARRLEFPVRYGLYRAFQAHLCDGAQRRPAVAGSGVLPHELSM
jgi:hypothetical protein